MKLVEVKLEELIPVRHRVLRPNRPLETCYFDGDLADTTRHFALRDEGRIYSVATILHVERVIAGRTYPLQLRGMATDEGYAGQGLGSRFLEQLNDHLDESWWCNAREVAVPFYERNGLSVLGDVFDIEGIGPHYVMGYNRDGL